MRNLAPEWILRLLSQSQRLIAGNSEEDAMDNKNVNRNRDVDQKRSGQESTRHKIGDKMERLGEKIYRKGNDIEHSGDNKNK